MIEQAKLCLAIERVKLSCTIEHLLTILTTDYLLLALCAMPSQMRNSKSEIRNYLPFASNLERSAPPTSNGPQGPTPHAPFPMLSLLTTLLGLLSMSLRKSSHEKG